MEKELLMIAVGGMCMVMDAAGFVINNMRHYNAYYRKGKDDQLVFMPQLFGK